MKTKNKMLRLLLINYYMILVQKKRKFKNRQCWVKPYLQVRNRNLLGAFQQMFHFFKQHDPKEFQNLTRLTVKQFDTLHNLVKRKLTKFSTFREPLSSDLKLAAVIM